MVSVNGAFGPNGVGGVGGEKPPETKKDDTPKTRIDELKIYKNGKKVYDDGKIDKIIVVRTDENGSSVITYKDSGKLGDRLH